MAVWTSYFKIVTPRQTATDYTKLATDSYNANAGGAVANVAWYSQVMKGAGSRLQRYSQYDTMDCDVDIARALDIIAEEVSNDDIKTNLPFEIEYQSEDNEDVADSVIVTVRAALRQWSKTQDLNNRIFRIARCLVKYGDCFFKKSRDTNRWEYIDPSKVIGIEIDEKGNKVAYHLRGSGAMSAGFGAKSAQVDVIPAEAIVHFTLSDDMGDSMPFGESLLQPIYRTFKQLTALEDSVVIYRLVRAPERRIFYIDVGNMPAQRVKQYLESVKNELRQKRMPNTQGPGGGVVDGTYDPHSISEDIFLASTASGRGTRVETLPGGENLGELAELKYFRDKLFKGLRVPTSYLAGPDAQGSQFNDGKVGIAYIEELRFCHFIERIQGKMEQVLHSEFMTYLKNISVNINPHLFLLRLPSPQNFALYKQAALDAEMINAYKSISDEKMLSSRFKLQRYLGLTVDELQMNEIMLKDELGIDENANLNDLRQIYDPIQMEARKAIAVKPKIEETSKKGKAPEGGGDEGGAPPEDDMGGLGSGMGDDLGGGLGGGDEGGMPDLGGI
jgi:hypothetical protein